MIIIFIGEKQYFGFTLQIMDSETVESIQLYSTIRLEVTLHLGHVNDLLKPRRIFILFRRLCSPFRVFISLLPNLR